MDGKIMDNFLKNKQFNAFCLFFVLICHLTVPAQSLNARFLQYIDTYKDVAQKYQRQYGVPASITLAQGLLESNAGGSYLAVHGNNHFGIKCYSWKGPAVEYNDTLRHDCYRKYGSAQDSFLDHAKFLCGPRYRVLHQLEITDYRSWAQGLRDCGYAEDPDYPRKLIGLIEQYELYKYDGGHKLSQQQKQERKLAEDHRSVADKDRQIQAEAHKQPPSPAKATRQQPRSPGRRPVAASADND